MKIVGVGSALLSVMTQFLGGVIYTVSRFSLLKGNDLSLLLTVPAWKAAPGAPHSWPLSCPHLIDEFGRKPCTCAGQPLLCPQDLPAGSLCSLTSLVVPSASRTELQDRASQV